MTNADSRGAKDRDAATALARLMEWYRGQCDGEWEHGHGITIKTLDNPGWSVDIDTVGSKTVLAESKSELLHGDEEDDWLVVGVRNGIFKGAGGPDKLGILIVRFLEMVER